MPEYLSPGVYVEEISTGPRPIEGVSTSTAGFVGLAERGPEWPRLVTSWLQFQRWYGGYIPDLSYLAYAVQGFFDNGGQRCFVSRIVPTGSALAGGPLGALVVRAIGRGAWANHIRIKVEKASEALPLGGNPARQPDWFKVSIIYYKDPPTDPFVDPLKLENLTNKDRKEPDVVEVYDNLSHIANSSNNVVTTINSASRLVRVWWTSPAEAAPLAEQGWTALGTQGSDGGDAATNRTVGSDDYVGDPGPMPGIPPGQAKLYGAGRGLKGLEAVDEVALLAVPDEVHISLPDDLKQQITIEVIKQCESLKDRFAVCSVGRGRSEAQDLRPPQDTTYAAFYYPWIQIYDAVARDNRLIPPTGHIVGLIARTDIERGVHKAPANEIVRDATVLEFPVPKGTQDILNPRNVNCIRDFSTAGRGIRLWGARTMSSDPMWKYINVRRLFIFIEESIDQGTQWVVFEPNDEPLWAQVRRTISNFLIGVWRSGALMGQTQDEAFFVKCDRTTMTQDDIDNGRLICYIGIAPVKPAEFVIFRISQKTLEAPS